MGVDVEALLPELDVEPRKTGTRRLGNENG
jgi:hypothetical protein